MKWTLLAVSLLPLSLLADPVACPTTTYAAYLSLGSCTVANYTMSDFTFSSHSFNQLSPAYTADQFTASGVDLPYNPTNSFYFGVAFTGDPGAPAGALVETMIDFDITSTDLSNSIAAVAIALGAEAGANGGVTLDDYGSGEGQPFLLQATIASPVAQKNFDPLIDTVHTHAVLISNGPELIQYFAITVTDVSDIPEPAVWSLMGSGLLGIGALLYRRKRLGLAA